MEIELGRKNNPEYAGTRPIIIRTEDITSIHVRWSTRARWDQKENPNPGLSLHTTFGTAIGLPAKCNRFSLEEIAQLIFAAEGDRVTQIPVTFRKEPASVLSEFLSSPKV